MVRKRRGGKGASPKPRSADRYSAYRMSQRELLWERDQVLGLLEKHYRRNKTLRRAYLRFRSGCGLAMADRDRQPYHPDDYAYPCYVRFCPHCAHKRHMREYDRVMEAMGDCDEDGLGFLTLNAARVPFGNLYRAIADALDAFRWLRKRDCFRGMFDLPFSRGVWTMQPRWESKDRMWMPHFHVVTYGTDCEGRILDILRRRWAEKTGRTDKRAVSWEPLRQRRLGNAASYMTRGLADVFVPGHLKKRMRHPYSEPVRLAVKTPEALTEYLDTLATWRWRLLETFGVRRRSSSKYSR